MPEKTQTLNNLEYVDTQGGRFAYSGSLRLAARKWIESLKYGHVKPNKDVPPDCVKGIIWFCEHFFNLEQ
jgi:hypothetical protein